LLSLVTAAHVGSRRSKNKSSTIEVLFDGFLRSTSDIFPRLLVSVSLSWQGPPNRCFFSPPIRLIDQKQKVPSSLTEASLKLLLSAITLCWKVKSLRTPISRSQQRHLGAFLQTWQICPDQRTQWNRPSSQRPRPPPSSPPRSLAAASSSS